MEPVATDYQRGHKQAEHQFGILQRGEHLSGTEHLFPAIGTKFSRIKNRVNKKQINSTAAVIKKTVRNPQWSARSHLPAGRAGRRLPRR